MPDQADINGRESTASYLQQRELCLEQARDFLQAAARVVGDDAAYPNVVYHLATLAIEEIGKAEMLVCCATLGGQLNSAWLEKRLSDHVFKLTWAFWSPGASHRIDPKEFEQARALAQSVHDRRLAAVYVDREGLGVPPRKVVTKDHATSLLELAHARLSLEQSPLTLEPNEDFEWYLATVSEEHTKRRLLSQAFIEKHAEFGGDTRAWIRWAREEFARITADELEHTRAELARHPSEPSNARPKWLITIRVLSPSHSVHQKALNVWNDQLKAVKLRAVSGKKGELLMELTVNDDVSIDRLFDFGLGQSKMYLALLSVGTAGIFWYELSTQAETYFESLSDLDSDKFVPRLTRTERLAKEWEEKLPHGSTRRRVALEEVHIHHALHCLAAFGPMPDAEVGPIFRPYLHGMALLCKTDVHLSLEAAARDAFFDALEQSMRRFFGWDGDVSALLSVLHRVLEPVVPTTEHRAQLLETISWNPSDGRALSAAVTMKRVADLCLVVAARKHLAEMVRAHAK